MSLNLFYAPGSCAFAALVALEEAGATYATSRLDMAEGDQRSASYRSINPLGRVPALQVGGKVVTEVVAVLTYIANRFPEAKLLSRDPLELAKEYEILLWFSTSLHAHIAQIFRGERFGDGTEVMAAVKRKGMQQFSEGLQTLDQICAKGDYYNAERFSLINAFGLVLWRWANRLDIDASALPAWSAIIQADLARPSVMRAVEAEANGERWKGAALAA